MERRRTGEEKFTSKLQEAADVMTLQVSAFKTLFNAGATDLTRSGSRQLWSDAGRMCRSISAENPWECEPIRAHRHTNCDTAGLSERRRRSYPGGAAAFTVNFSPARGVCGHSTAPL